MKAAIFLSFFFLSTSAFAEIPTADKVFSILKNNGVFVECTATTAGCISNLQLNRLECVKYDRTEESACTFVDAARQRESGKIEKVSSAEIYSALVLSGIEPLHLFGESRIAISMLQCEKALDRQATCKALREIFKD